MGYFTILSDPSENAVSPADVAAIVSSTELIEVRLDEVHAGPVAASVASMQVSLSRGEPGYAYIQDQELLLVRLEHQLDCSEESQTGIVAEIGAFHIAAFRVTTELEVEAAAIAAWIETNVYFIAYPYVRQFFTSITSAMGLPPVVLGYMKRTDWPYRVGDSDTGTGELDGLKES